MGKKGKKGKRGNKVDADFEDWYDIGASADASENGAAAAAGDDIEDENVFVVPPTADDGDENGSDDEEADDNDTQLEDENGDPIVVDMSALTAAAYGHNDVAIVTQAILKWISRNPTRLPISKEDLETRIATVNTLVHEVDPAAIYEVLGEMKLVRAKKDVGGGLADAADEDGSDDRALIEFARDAEEVDFLLEDVLRSVPEGHEVAIVLRRYRDWFAKCASASSGGDGGKKKKKGKAAVAFPKTRGAFVDVLRAMCQVMVTVPPHDVFEELVMNRLVQEVDVEVKQKGRKGTTKVVATVTRLKYDDTRIKNALTGKVRPSSGVGGQEEASGMLGLTYAQWKIFVSALILLLVCLQPILSFLKL
eukprot:TRINITY_DN4911_c0_g1_i1.p1 TRINITY_DN4911_c0_g1~~TRINITY_DN4911_c0_g1_i1.p1  ORF type:complete len:413 (+),score=131.55 TRINITY_DN4911_c0_g1_i1:149-1240(+)